jgi:hypothetical protein
MTFIPRGRRLAWLGMATVGGSLLLSPLAAQQMAPRLLPAAFPQAQPEGQVVDKEVRLDVDGRFRAVVLTPDGSPVRGARLVLTGTAKPLGPSRAWVTGTNGTVVISGITPGAYRSVVVAARGRYRGLLLVRAGSGDGPAEPFVTFTLDCCCTSEAREFDPGMHAAGAGLVAGGLADPLLIGAGVAAAAALSLSLEGEKEALIIPVASP